MQLHKTKEHIKEKAINAQKIFWGYIRKENRNAPVADRVSFLTRIPIFRALSKGQLNEVAQIVYERHYDENEFIFQVDQPGAALFMIQSGKVSVEVSSKEGCVHIATLKHDAFLGEMALLDNAPRSASARALTPTTVLALSRDDLNTLLQTDPGIASQIYKALASIISSRLKATNELLDSEQEAA